MDGNLGGVSIRKGTCTNKEINFSYLELYLATDVGNPEFVHSQFTLDLC